MGYQVMNKIEMSNHGLSELFPMRQWNKTHPETAFRLPI